MARNRGGSGLSTDADEARQQLLLAAEQVITRYGIAKTTMDDIGREAGVSRPTVYRYFRDRDALLGALIERRSRVLFERARTFVLGYETFAEQFVEGLVYLVDRGRKDPLVRLLVSPAERGQNTPIDGGSALATNLTAEMWTPIFQQAMDRGEIRDDLDMTAVAQWLTMVQFVLVDRFDLADPGDPSHRTMLKQFVLPAFLPMSLRVPPTIGHRVS